MYINAIDSRRPPNPLKVPVLKEAAVYEDMLTYYKFDKKTQYHFNGIHIKHMRHAYERVVYNRAIRRNRGLPSHKFGTELLAELLVSGYEFFLDQEESTVSDTLCIYYLLYDNQIAHDKYAFYKDKYYQGDSCLYKGINCLNINITLQSKLKKKI